MSELSSGRHALRTESPTDGPLTPQALTREIEHNRRAEYRLLIWTATSLLVVALLIVVHLLWL